MRRMAAGDGEESHDGMTVGSREFFARSDGIRIRSIRDCERGIQSLIQSYESKMIGIEELKGSDLRIDHIRNLTLQVLDIESQCDSLCNIEIMCSVQVGGLPPVKSACAGGDAKVGLTQLQRRGVTSITLKNGVKCLKDSVCVSMNWPRVKEETSRMYRRSCNACGKGREKDRSACDTCVGKTSAWMTANRSKPKTWARFMNSVRDEGVNYPATQEDLETLEENYREQKVRFHVYDRRGEKVIISDK